MEGGYQIIDLKNKVLSETGDGTLISGIYELIEGTRKPLLIQNVVIEVSGSPKEFRDFFVSPSIRDTYFDLQDFSQNIGITITDGDLVFGFDYATLNSKSININSTLEVDQDGKLGVASV